MNEKEMELTDKIKLVRFATKAGVYVYVGDKLVGALADCRIVREAEGKTKWE